MKPVFFTVTFLALISISASAQITSGRAMTKRIAPLTQRPPASGALPTKPAAPAAGAAAQRPAVDIEKQNEMAAKRVEYQKKKAEEGVDYAQYDLGIRYLTGDGVEKDPKVAEQWLKKAAAQGHADAKKKLEEIQAAAK